MIPEERLRVAAKESCERYVDALLSTIDADAPHTFSPVFEAKIEKLKRNIGKKSPRRVLQKVASFVLAVLVCAGAWLAVDAEARSKVVGWVKGVYDGLFVYHFESSSENRINAPKKEYHITWMPDGYSLWKEDSELEGNLKIYINEEGNLLNFDYVQNPDDVYWMFELEQAQAYRITATVNGHDADVLISRDSKHSNAILWTLPDNTAFYIGAYLDAEELVKIAESVQPMEN